MPFDNLRNKLGRAKQALGDLPTQEERVDMEEDLTMLPNEAMAGRGLFNTLSALSELAPEPVVVKPEEKIPGTNLTAPAIAIDPMMAMGSLKTVRPSLLDLRQNVASNSARKAALGAINNEERLLKDANFVKTREQMRRVNQPKLAEQMAEYKKTSPLQSEVNTVSGKEIPQIDTTPQKIISGDEFKAKQEAIRKRLDEKEAAKRAAKGKK